MNALYQLDIDFIFTLSLFSNCFIKFRQKSKYAMTIDFYQFFFISIQVYFLVFQCYAVVHFYLYKYKMSLCKIMIFQVCCFC